MSEVELPNPEELEEMKGRRFTKRVALTTAIFAVVLAIASLGGNHATREMLLAQQQASDQWAYYQAKVVREHLNRGNKLVFEAHLAEPSALKGPERAKYEALVTRFADEEKRMAADKKEIEQVARKHEAERDRNQAKDPYFDYAEVCLQIAIVTSSVSILAASRPMFGFSMTLAVLGALLASNGFTLLVKIPLLHGH